MKKVLENLKPNVLFTFSLIILLNTSCRTYFGLKPTNPELGPTKQTLYPVIDSLKPTLSWKPKVKSNATITYDITIWKINVDEKYFKKNKEKKGRNFYPGIPSPNKYLTSNNFTKTNIKEPFYQLENILEPNSVYLWSVQYNINGKSKGWSVLVIDRHYTATIGNFTGYNYGFVTPSQ
ncbi:MAG TPA: hypothetical protein PKH65_07100 [Bacteroidia bacterium]|nr:hypothetical protein [Bacteroidia bacterium]